MVAETVIMEIDADTPYDEGLARVTASFTMRNLGEKPEEMIVGFPLADTIGTGECTLKLSPYSPIEDLAAWVNGNRVATHKVYQTLQYPGGEILSIACWENFTVIFAPNQDVFIKVTYTEGPTIQFYPNYEYIYILHTGAGWKGTIGSADIILRLPYELNAYNYFPPSYSPEEYTVTKNEIRWHQEDFEPDQDFSVSLLSPPLWQRILVERANTTHDPNDGETWGRLAKAYKETVWYLWGYRDDPPGKDMYNWSVEAYRKAVTLLPQDADWHFGFAELLCNKTSWDSRSSAPDIDAWKACFEQIQQTLDLDPDHKKAHELLQKLADIDWIEVVDLSGPTPIFLILTPGPTSISTPTLIQMVTRNAFSGLATPYPSATSLKKVSTKTVKATAVSNIVTTPTPLPTVIPEVTNIPSVIPEATNMTSFFPEVMNRPSTPAKSPVDLKVILYIGSGILVVIFMIGAIKIRKKLK